MINDSAYSVSQASFRQVRGDLIFLIFTHGHAAVLGTLSDLAIFESVVSLSGSENVVTAAVSAPNLSREKAASLPGQNLHYRLGSNYITSLLRSCNSHSTRIGRLLSFTLEDQWKLLQDVAVRMI